MVEGNPQSNKKDQPDSPTSTKNNSPLTKDDVNSYRATRHSKRNSPDPVRFKSEVLNINSLKSDPLKLQG